MAYTVLRIVGAVLLLTLGVRAWQAAWRDRGDPLLPNDIPSTGSPSPRAPSRWTAFAEGLLVQVVLETGLYLGLAVTVGRASGWFGRAAVRRRLEAASGTVLVALGLRVALSSR